MNIFNYYLTWENKIYNLLECHKKMEFYLLHGIIHKAKMYFGTFLTHDFPMNWH
jgi:hypothetical protein